MDLNKASGDISDLIKGISDARAKVPKPAQLSYFDSLDKQFSALLSGLVTGTGVVGNPTNPTGGTLLMSIISGKALINSLSLATPSPGTAIGVSVGGWHDFRHTLVRRMRRAGVNPVVISGVVGHKSVELAPEVYDRASAADIGRALGLVGRQLLPSMLPTDPLN